MPIAWAKGHKALAPGSGSGERKKGGKEEMDSGLTTKVELTEMTQMPRV